MGRNKVDMPMNRIACLYYLCQMSVAKIGEILDIKHQTIYARMKKNGMILRPQKVSMGKGSASANWKGGIYSCCGYLRVASGENEGQLVHREKAEKALGRKLQSDEDVHHINGKRDDNRNINLLICSHSYHIWLHRMIDIKNNKLLFGRELCQA